MTNLSSSCCGVNGDRGVGGSEKVTVVMGVLIGVGAGLVSNMEVMLVGVGAVMGADVGVRVVSVVGVGVGGRTGGRCRGEGGFGSRSWSRGTRGCGCGSEGGGGIGGIVDGSWSRGGRRSGGDGGVAAEVGEGVGPKVLMGIEGGGPGGGCGGGGEEEEEREEVRVLQRGENLIETKSLIGNSWLLCPTYNYLFPPKTVEEKGFLCNYDGLPVAFGIS
ncbi:hypothetical protein OIU77_015479 [Salix suchowensis]|uniref:Glycine-rich protein n=1 Tax=Salix suchowensis TaxID=1278906 RepID=A0ABQ8ZHJ2_9ROSI|nr:hypothetical protein OIU77_015479 [Salix suchowensis]